MEKDTGEELEEGGEGRKEKMEFTSLTFVSQEVYIYEINNAEAEAYKVKKQNRNNIQLVNSFRTL